MPKAQPKRFSDLTEEQRDRFETRVKRLNIPRDRVPASVVAEGNFVVHADPALTSQQTFPIVVKNLAEFKELGGIPDSRYAEEGYSDVYINYPPPIPTERLRLLQATRFAPDALSSALTFEEQGLIPQAMTAYTMGNSEKVSPEWVEIADATNFPMEVAAVVAEDLVIKGEYLIQGPGPVELTFGTVTIEPGGYIKALVPVTFNAQVITRL
jgi:hypothetical protein